MNRRLTMGLASLAAVALAAGGALAATSMTRAADPSSSPKPTATAHVERRTLTATTQTDGKLGYTGAYAVTNMLASPVGPDGVSVVTQIAAVGSTVQPGGVLYTLNGNRPAVLMRGSTPTWRALQSGVSDGVDVTELEESLQALGFTPSGMAIDSHWDSNTTAAVKAWQKSLGATVTGTVPLGQVVFEPVALRIISDASSVGSVVQRGSPILQATSTRHVVFVALDPATQTQIEVGEAVSITLPNGSSTHGTISEIGTVATTAPQSNGQSGPPTIAVTVTLDDQNAAGTLDQAPVSVGIVTATATDVLAVPVTALVALLEGGYAIQTEQNGQLAYVSVQLGLFANGWVQVTGQGISAGQTVVVAQ